MYFILNKYTCKSKFFCNFQFDSNTLNWELLPFITILAPPPKKKLHFQTGFFLSMNIESIKTHDQGLIYTRLITRCSQKIIYKFKAAIHIFNLKIKCQEKCIPINTIKCLSSYFDCIAKIASFLASYYIPVSGYTWDKRIKVLHIHVHVSLFFKNSQTF